MWVSVLGMFAQSQKSPITFVMSICMSTYSALLTLDGFIWNFILETSIQICWGISDLFNAGQKYRALYMETKVQFIAAGEIKSK